jgi:putative MATE family efflux protein
MKKGLIASFWYGITDVTKGESYKKITRYFFPEYVTALVLYSLLYLLDAAFIANLKSTSMYATLGVTNTMLHFIVKFAEGISIGAVILGGTFNGLGKFKDVGKTFINSFWLMVFIGAAVSSILYFGAYWIYYLYRVPTDMIYFGVPFLRTRALGIFFMFLYFAFVGFLRSIKNTKTPMKIFIGGAIAFLFFDYVLIFGKLGFPKMGLQGSATASVIQYGVMLVLAGVTIFFKKKYRKYGLKLFSLFSSSYEVWKLLKLSWPVILDKSSITIAYIWLGAMLVPTGKFALATFSVVKDLERFALLPAAAFAQVVTFLVSNDYGRRNWDGIKANIKKIIFLASIMVFSFLIVLALWPQCFIQFFDKNGDFIGMASKIVPLLGILVFFDVLQLILAGAMRGSSNVKTVMITRVLICGFYFFPVSFWLSRMDIENMILKFVLIYGSFYIGTGFMSVVYINRFRGQKWKPSDESDSEIVQIGNKKIK